jgi:hypothetical protein
VTGSVTGASAPSAELTTKSGTIRPVTDGENRGRSGKYSPRYRASNSGQLAASIRPVVSPAYSGQVAGHHPPRGLAANSQRESIRPVNAMRRRPEIGQRNRGANGHCPPRYRRCWRPVTVSSATIPLAFGPFTSAPGNRAGAPLRQTWNVNTEGNCIRERDCIAYRNLASAGTVPLAGQLRPHRRSMANIGTVPLAFTWLITLSLRR